MKKNNVWFVLFSTLLQVVGIINTSVERIEKKDNTLNRIKARAIFVWPSYFNDIFMYICNIIIRYVIRITRYS